MAGGGGSGDRTKLPLSVNGLAGQILRARRRGGGRGEGWDSLTSASSFIVNLQCYLLPLLLPRGRAIELTYHLPPPPPPPRTHENIPFPRLTLPPNRNSEYGRKSTPPHPLFRPPPRPPIIASVIDWIIKVLITHPSSSAPRLPSAHPFGPRFSPSLPFRSGVGARVRACSTPRQIICSGEA